MATVSLRPGKTEIQLTARGRASRLPPLLLEVPGGLYPLRSAAFEVDEYRIMAGWPVAVPPVDIRAYCLFSAEGEITGRRKVPTELVTNATARWVADATYYDQTSIRWRSLQSNIPPWESSVAHAPSLIKDYEYRIGHERFIGQTALNFDSDTNDYMWVDLTLAMGGISGYTVIMVVCPNSYYGNDLGVAANAFWGPEDPVGAWTAFSVKEQAIWMTTDAQTEQQGVAFGDALAGSAPSYVALVVGRPQTTMYAAPGPSNVKVKSLVAGPVPQPLSARFRLGWGPNPLSATMDMALLDLGLYPNLLTKGEVVAEFATLSQAYGGSA